MLTLARYRGYNAPNPLQRGRIMKGWIDSRKKCSCGGTFKHDENRSGLFCQKCDHRSNGPFRVRFGRDTTQSYKNYDDAEEFLLHLRHLDKNGKFDPRDFLNSAPLGFVVQAEKWLERKRGEVKPKVLKNIELTFKRAADLWGNRNVKDLSGGDIEDFLLGLKSGNKARADRESHLKDFWRWLARREGIALPQFPGITFKLGYRPIIDIPTQQLIIDKIREQNARNPKAWLAIRMLSRYFHIRPGELMRLNEGDINLEIPSMTLEPEKAKIGELNMIFLWADDVEIMKTLPRGLPDLPYFRHPAGKRAEAGKPFGQRFLYKIWTNACKALGLMRSDTLPICDLYAGTRHSTMTALGEFMRPSEVQEASGHRTTKAMMRYLQGRARYAQKQQDIVANMQARARGEVVRLSERKAGNDASHKIR